MAPDQASEALSQANVTTVQKMEPSKEQFDFPAAAITAQFAGVLGVLLTAIVLVGRDEPDAVFLPEAFVECIAVEGAVANHASWFGSREALLDGGFDEFRFMRRSDGEAAGTYPSQCESEARQTL